MDFFFEQKSSALSFRENNHLTFDPHFHNEAEFVYMLSGETKCIVDGENYTLTAGDALLVFPNQVHSYTDTSEIKNTILIFDPAEMPELKGIFKNSIPLCPRISHDLLNGTGFRNTLNFILRDYSESNPCTQRGYMLVLAGKLLEQCELTESRGSSGMLLRDILTYCADNYRRPLQLEDVARELHISRSYLSHTFSGKLKMGFSDYINLLRVNDAKRMLSDTDMSVTEISDAAGFQTLRTFNRAFMRSAGKSPRDYRAGAAEMAINPQFRDTAKNLSDCENPSEKCLCSY